MVSISAYSQNAKFGVKGGLNIANIANSENCESLIGGHLGIFFTTPINEKISIQPEILYSNQGVKSDEEDGPEMILNYINVPVILKLNLAENFNLEFGPQIGFISKAEMKNDKVAVNIDDQVESVDVSLAFGAEFVTPVGFALYFRYNFGLSQVNKEDAIGGDNGFNRVLSFGAAYRF